MTVPLSPEALRSDSHRIRTVERGIPSSPLNSSDSLPFPSVQRREQNMTAWPHTR